MLALGLSAQETARWEQIKECPATYTFYITKGGRMLLSDYLYDGNGGIYTSDDNGASWEKADVADYCYNKFFEDEGYVFALGNAGRIARSADEGRTWELLNYQYAVKDLVDEKGLDYTTAYAIAAHKGRLYVADFSGGGVIYSEDAGETWGRTDVESLSYVMDSSKPEEKPVVENIYNLVSYKDRLYAFGVYFVFRLDETDDTWEMIRDDSNFMTQSAIYQGRLCCGRSIMNDTYDVPFVLCTEDGDAWDELPRPEGLMDNNIRAMAADGDNLYVGLQSHGIYYTPDGGAHWANISNGLPLLDASQSTSDFLIPMAFASTAEYVYVALYATPFASDASSGVYRMPKSMLPDPVTGISQGASSVGTEASLRGNSLFLGDGASGIEILDTSGRTVPVSVHDGTADLSTLHRGTYVYRFQNDGRQFSGKILKR